MKTTYNFHVNTNIDEIVKRFWIQEVVPKHNDLTAEEKLCESHFVNNYQRDEFGRFIVRLPFIENKVDLGDSLSTAIKRLSYLERKFENDHVFKNEYVY